MSILTEAPWPSEEANRGKLDIIRCDRKAQFNLGVLCLSDRVHGYNTHFSGRTYHCPGPDGDCTLCKIGKRQRWVGYVAATNRDRQTQWLVELTPGTMKTVKRFVDLGHPLRGAWMKLERKSRHPTGRVTLTITANALGLAPADLPPAEDVPSALAYIWDVKRRVTMNPDLLVSPEAKQRQTALPEARSGVTVAGNGCRS